MPTTEQLWLRFSDDLRRFLDRRLPPDVPAEDVLQDVFIRIHQGLPKLRDEDRVAGWIHGIARRAVADAYRSRRPAEPLPAEPLPADFEGAVPEPEPQPHHGAHDVHEEVLAWMLPLIDALDEPDRTALRMADVEGRLQAEVAEALGLSLSGAKSRIQRARRKLGEVLAACCAVEFGPDGRVSGFERQRPTCRAENC